MKTVKKNFNATVYVYAEALSDYQIKNLKPGELPFEYKVKGYDFGDERSVRICEQKIVITIPDGIDVTMECIKNLEERINAIEKEALKEVADLRKRIRNLALIEYRPTASDADDPNGNTVLNG